LIFNSFVEEMWLTSRNRIKKKTNLARQGPSLNENIQIKNNGGYHQNPFAPGGLRVRDGGPCLRRG
jgi:hypothetical protein